MSKKGYKKHVKASTNQPKMEPKSMNKPEIWWSQIDAKNDEKQKQQFMFFDPATGASRQVYEADYLQKTYLTEKQQTIGLRDRLLER